MFMATDSATIVVVLLNHYTTEAYVAVVQFFLESTNLNKTFSRNNKNLVEVMKLCVICGNIASESDTTLTIIGCNNINEVSLLCGKDVTANAGEKVRIDTILPQDGNLK